MKTIDRINQLLNEQGVPERSRRSLVSKITKASYESVRKWFSGETQEIGTEYLARLAKYYNRPVDWFLGDSRKTHSVQEQAGVYNGNLMPLIRKQKILEFIESQEGLGSDPEYLDGIASSIKSEYRAAFAFKETTEGMVPHIYPGDIIMVDPAQSIPHAGADSVWLFRAGDGVSLGKIYETVRGLVLKFDNQGTGWESMPVPGSDCLGKVVGLIPRWLARP